MPLTWHNTVPTSAPNNSLEARINQSRKNPYLLKHSPSSNLRTLLLGPTSSDRLNADFLFSLILSPFLLLPSPFLLLPSHLISFLSLSFFSFFSLSFLLGCPSPELISSHFISMPIGMHVDTCFAMCHTCICLCMSYDTLLAMCHTCIGPCHAL